MSPQVTSPLTTLTSISTPASYYTAKDSPRDSPPNTADLTNISSPAEEPSRPRYREARKLPDELREHCKIHLEEKLCRS